VRVGDGEPRECRGGRALSGSMAARMHAEWTPQMFKVTRAHSRPLPHCPAPVSAALAALLAHLRMFFF